MLAVIAVAVRTPVTGSGLDEPVVVPTYQE
jgi:hypothetical protein